MDRRRWIGDCNPQASPNAAGLPRLRPADQPQTTRQILPRGTNRQPAAPALSRPINTLGGTAGPRPLARFLLLPARLGHPSLTPAASFEEAPLCPCSAP